MVEKPKITGFEVIQFDLPPMEDMGTDYNGFNMVYEKGSTTPRQGSVLRMFTSVGVTGEIASGAGLVAQSRYRNYLLGKNPLERELIYQDLKRALRQQARMGMAQIDVDPFAQSQPSGTYPAGCRLHRLFIREGIVVQRKRPRFSRRMTDDLKKPGDLSARPFRLMA